MVKFLAGINRKPNKADLALARERLKRSYVGFQETFDTDLLNLQELYPGVFKSVEYEYKNKTKTEWHDITHSEEVISQVRAVNQWDIELYEWAKECLLWDKFLDK